MTDQPNPEPLLSRNHEGVEFITIYADGRVILRHRDAGGHLRIHIQNIPILPEVIQNHGPPGRWVAEVIKLPTTSEPFLVPNRVVALRSSAKRKTSEFLLTFTPWDEHQIHLLHNLFPDFILLVNAGNTLVHQFVQASLLLRNPDESSTDDKS